MQVDQTNVTSKEGATGIVDFGLAVMFSRKTLAMMFSRSGDQI